MYFIFLTNGSMFECSNFKTAYHVSRCECRSYMNLRHIACGATIYYSRELISGFKDIQDKVIAGIAKEVAFYRLDSWGESFMKLRLKGVKL